MTRFAVPLAILWLGTSTVHAQARFSIPLRVTDGVDTYTLSFGVAPYAHFCVVESDSINGLAEYFLPPVPPGGVFDARFVWPKPGSNLPCFDQGTSYDFRPYTSITQSDTFRMKCQLGSGAAMILSWPPNLFRYVAWMTLRYFDQNLGQNVDMNMMTDTTADVTAAGDPAVVTMVSHYVIESVEQPPISVPKEYALSQNYPNPFNPSTTIRYALPHNSFVTLTVYNTLGQQVAQLVNEQQQAGYHDVVFRGDGLPSGVYFYRLSTSNFVQTRKLSLLR